MLQENKLYLGDCLQRMQRIPDRSIDLILVDLPYGMTRNKWDVIIPLDQLWDQYLRIIKPGKPMVFTANQPFTTTLISSNPRLFKYDLIWDKKLSVGFLNAKKRPLRRHEEILVFCTGSPIYNPQMRLGKLRNKGGKNRISDCYGKFSANTVFNNTYYPTSILEISAADRRDRFHPNQKPVELFEYLIRTFSSAGDLALDHCAGSGTTGIACINTHRRFILIEKEPEYVKQARARIDQAMLAYRKATRESLIELKKELFHVYKKLKAA